MPGHFLSRIVVALLANLAGQDTSWEVPSWSCPGPNRLSRGCVCVCGVGQALATTSFQHRARAKCQGPEDGALR